MKGTRFIIAGGGTGGHIFPAIAIANEIKRRMPGATILFVGATGKMEMEKVPQAGYAIEGITIAGFNRSSLIKNIQLPFKLVKSFIQVQQIFKNFKPEAVIGVGGYSSFPVLKYAQVKGLPTFLHESNLFAGKSNTLLSKKASKVFTAAAGMEKFFPAGKIVVTGNPVRKAIVQNEITRQEGLDHFNLKPGNQVVLSVGGSLGAKSINEAIAKGINLFNANNLQLIWQTGKPFIAQGLQVSKEATNVYVNDFIQQMEYAYAAADIVISRSGAMAIAELCLVKKPVIFVPYPFAAEDHQTANAKTLVDKEAALILTDKEAAEKLIKEVILLSKDTELQNKLKRNISPLGIPNADEKIVNEILAFLNI
ncbi:MAG: undecaprenyldiphospho-muramoylpentapeptide beta-N-acetylglucosaminyltransferase [Ferruginibacter sp.]